MSEYKKFWKKKPIARRLAALGTLVFMPVLLPAFALVECWDEVVQCVSDNYKAAWSVFVAKEKP